MPISVPVRDPRLIPTTIGQRAVVAKHALHELFAAEWENLAHVREGTGGFMDGTFLVGHPREWVDHESTDPQTPTKKFKARRTLAHYENIAAAILEAKKSVLFRETATRRIGDDGDDLQHDLKDRWWPDVDGLGHSIDEVMPLWWDIAATFGHAVLYFEPPNNEGVEVAADQDQPRVRIYTPLDVLNWLTNDQGEMVAIKVAEAVPHEVFTETATASAAQFRVREITTEGWTLFDQQGSPIARGEHGLGRLPVTYLYGRRRAVMTGIGQSVLGRSQQYIDLYNLVSELRELLRNQTFSFINLPLGTGDSAMNVTDAQTMLGQQTGTMNVLFSALPANILTGDASNVTAYQDEIKQRKRDIFRVTGVQWESDSRDAESGDSLRLKREDMNTRVAGYADECQQAEMDLVDLWYRWQFGPDDVDQRIRDDNVVVQYPAKFDATPFEELVLQIQAAADIKMPDLFLKALRKNIIAKFEGMSDLDAATLDAITTEIDAQEELDPIDQARQMMAMKSEFVGGNEDEDEDEEADDDVVPDNRT